MIVLNNELDFNTLEKKIYEYGCQIAREMMHSVLISIDDQLAEDRDRKIYRDKGKRKTAVKTLMGEVEFQRRVYRLKEEGAIGGKKHIYLLDQALGFNKIGLFSANLVQLVTEAATNNSFRKAADSISKTTGQTISHTGAWNILQAIGEKISLEEEHQVEALKENCKQGKKEVDVLFEEADGVYLSIQGKDRKKTGKQELKVSISYEGWKKTSKGRYEVVNKLVCAGFEKASEFRKRKEALLGSKYNLDEIQMRFLNGDGDNWIKNYSDLGEIHYQLDPFHKSRAIIRNVQDKKARKTMLKFLRQNKYEEIMMYISALKHDSQDKKEKKKLGELETYFLNNQSGLVPYLERGLDLPDLEKGLVYRSMGTMEHNICDVISLRMKGRKGSWSLAGGGNMAKVLAAKASCRLEKILNKFTTEPISPELTKVIKGSLSASKSPKKDGKGYDYPVKGGWPFEGASKTNGRDAIRQLVSQWAL